MAQGLARLGQEMLGVLGLAQRAGAHGAHAARRLHAQALAEALQAGQAALDRPILEALGAVQALGQGDAVAQAVEHDQLSVDVLRHHHVEAVGSQVDRRDGFALRRGGIRFTEHVFGGLRRIPS